MGHQSSYLFLTRTIFFFKVIITVKKCKLLIYARLILLTSTMTAQASDFIEKEKFDLFFDKVIKSSYDQKSDEIGRTQESNVRGWITEDRLKLNIQDRESAYHFINNCQNNHFLLTGYPENEAHLDFFQSEHSFQDYLGDHWRNDKQLEKCWISYHMLAAWYFLGVENFTETEKSLLSALETENSLLIEGEANLSEFRGQLGSFIAMACRDADCMHEQNGATIDSNHISFLYEKYGNLYENVRKRDSITGFDLVDNITLSVLYQRGNQYQRSINFGKQALYCENSWPSPESNPYFRLTVKPHVLKSHMAYACYKLEMFEEALNLTSEIPHNCWILDNYMLVSCIFGKRKMWIEAFEHINSYWLFLKEESLEKNIDSKPVIRGLSSARTIIKKTTDTPKSFVKVDKDLTIDVLTMMTKLSLNDFKKHAQNFFNIFKLIDNQLPCFKSYIDAVQCNLTQKKEEKAHSLIRQAIAQQYLEDIHKIYESFDQQYQNLWAHGSLLPSKMGEEYFHSLADIAQQIETDYSKLDLLKTEESSYADNISDIRELSESLKKKTAHFYGQVKEMNHQISKMRRQLYKEDQSTAAQKGNYIEFKPSLKAQSLVELKEKESEDKVRVDIITSKKQVRKVRRVALNQTYQEKSKQDERQIENEKSSNIRQGSLISFKDKKLQNLWENKDLPENALEMLEALHRAKSIFQLRTYLNPGAKLEILSGDREGQISLRVNDQYRLCFYWISGEGAYNVELIDYHR